MTYQDRQHIEQALADGAGYAEIARRLGRPTSTVSREVARNGGSRGYRALAANRATAHRARRTGPVARPPVEQTTGYGRDPAAVAAFEQRFVAMMVESGFPRMTARVLVSLFVSDSGALTAADLVARLRVSPASISKSIAFLERIGFVARQRTPGHRRDRYAVDDGLWYRAWSLRVHVFRTWADAAAEGAGVLGPQTPAGDRLQLMGEFFGLVVRDVERITAEWQAFLSARGQPLPPPAAAPVPEAAR
ncbi:MULTISPECIES: GbsR/MarR family transcriptional regulator [unclassified Solwaraspora]|uniref:GbsR/MarR family transcriptional regulator n=1 Tax=unclassified Solwaraspora TaxID=2627926 RepID=UPI00259B6B6B|nr:helix-turn-helix domain-containing protein [Solwaraspora sp. WMMA2056]WJK42810.1 helix-turn-helix domain-containing protein [Solwaraspora sp. WMMA2056]